MARKVNNAQSSSSNVSSSRQSSTHLGVTMCFLLGLTNSSIRVQKHDRTDSQGSLPRQLDVSSRILFIHYNVRELEIRDAFRHPSTILYQQLLHFGESETDQLDALIKEWRTNLS